MYFAEREGLNLGDFINLAVFEKIQEVAPEFQPSSGGSTPTAIYEERMKEGFQMSDRSSKGFYR